MVTAAKEFWQRDKNACEKRIKIEEIEKF